MDAIVRCSPSWFVNDSCLWSTQVFNESSTFRGVIKTLAREVVKDHYSDIISPDYNPSDEEISGNQLHIQQIGCDGLREILDDCSFHYGGFDDNVCQIFLYDVF